MIRINLLKSTARKKSKEPRKAGRGGIVAAAVGGGALLLVLGGFGAYRYLLKRPTVEPPPAPVSDFKPSTHKRSNIVEDIVREVNDERARSLSSGLLDVPYAEMAFGEKVCYEVLFARNVVQMLGRAVPSGIGLRTLEVQDFQTVYMVGLGSSRDLVSSMFTTLKNERIELLTPPYSYIKSNSATGYRFVVTCKTRYGLDLADPFQAIDHLAARDDLSILLKKIAQFAAQDGLRIRGDLKQVSAERAGAYRRYIYGMVGSGSYRDFVKFVLHLNTERVPCAFKTMKLSAHSGGNVDIDAEILFTIRE